MKTDVFDALEGSSFTAEQGLASSSPDAADVDSFNSFLQGDTLGNHFDVPGGVHDRISSLDALSSQASEASKTASTSSDPLDMYDMSRAISSYSLEMALTTKVISKVTGSIDKLMNLQ